MGCCYVVLEEYRTTYTGCVRLTRVRLHDEEYGPVASQSQFSRTRLRPRHGRPFLSLRISCRVTGLHRKSSANGCVRLKVARKLHLV
ncbi:hypothetical protein Y032_0237g3243 [Ancylostoma ceylanicum]|uniref:Uncharacterized protein n=1 Tax=Ancylostoma ceylanicum TaxID=53326 RepID=A0A016SFI4_9BILA|nr:hypothetical protein Y032_0237g3243 [Ancylostoma ceylanicum]